MIKKLLGMTLLAAALNGCSVASPYTALVWGGEDLAHCVERNYTGATRSLLAPAAFIGGTIASPFLGLFWGVQGDANFICNVVSGRHPEWDNDYFTLAQYPFSGPARIEEEEARRAADLAHVTSR